MGHCRHDVELRERAGGGDGGAAQACEVVAIGMGDPLDQEKMGDRPQFVFAADAPWIRAKLPTRQALSAAGVFDGIGSTTWASN
jgi:hypothetical protein